MNPSDLEKIAAEIAAASVGRSIARIFCLSRHQIAFDLDPHAGAYIYADVTPQGRRSFLIRRRLKDLERQSITPDPNTVELRDSVVANEVAGVSVAPGGGALRIRLSGPSDADALVIQLSGPVPDILCLGEADTIIASLRHQDAEGLRVGDRYSPPTDLGREVAPIFVGAGKTLSDVLDQAALARKAEDEFASQASAARKRLNAEIAKKRKLLNNLHGDLEQQGDPEQWKRYGDLLLANIGTARRGPDGLTVTDYFDAEMPQVTIPVEDDRGAAEAAEAYFKKYSKARNGLAVIMDRIQKTESEITSLEERSARLESAIAAEDSAAVSSFLPQPKVVLAPKARKQRDDALKGLRRFISTDGFEILVGKRSVDNDRLTFRVANSLDTWLHAADYPGSHVVIRNPKRIDIPDRALIEAAQLAAFYSDARGQGKAAVHYTLRKFVNKPRRAAPGLVSLASFKTLMVEPKVGVSLAQD